MNYPLVKNIASQKIIFLDLDSVLDDAIKLITESGVRNIVIHDEDINEYAYIGVDEVVHAIANNINTDISISEIGLHPLISVPKNYNIFEASYFFIENELLIGVMNDDGTLFGVLSYVDILTASMSIEENTLESPVSSMVMKNCALKSEKGVELSSLLERLDTVGMDCIVVHEDDIPLGIITKRDITRRIANSQTLECLVEECMHSPVSSIHGSISVRQALDTMQEKKYKRIFVTENNGTMLGVITQKELISVIYNKFSHKAILSVDKLNNILNLKVSSKSEEIKELKERYEYALAASTHGIWDWDISTDNIVLSKQFQKMLGVQSTKIKNMSLDFNALIHQEDKKRVILTRDENIQNGVELFDLEYRILHANKGYAWVKDRSKIIYKNAIAVRIVSTITNITEYKNMQEEIDKQKDILNYQANYDNLTGLPNREKSLKRLDKAIFDSNDTNTRFALLFIDLDHFKEINDSLGHHIGDEVLKSVAKRISSLLEDNDTLSRLGGDEFIIIEENFKDIQDISSLAKKIIKEMRNPIEVANNTLFVSCSIGISLYPDDSLTNENLLKHADTAMYKAKEDGRNMFSFYTSHMTEMALQRVRMETDLHKALVNDEFEVYYQPQYDAKNSKLLGLEALVRWNHTKDGLISPIKFIPLAEDTGLIIELDQIVMKKAMKQVAEWYDKGYNPGVLALNLAVKQLQQKDFITILSTIMEELSFKPQWLELELTEGQVMKNPNEAIVKLQQIIDLGVGVAIDDFGTGYSSLAYLKRLPINKLKIDQSFIKDIPHNNEDTAIVKVVIDLASSLNLNIIAEGVENELQKDFLVNNGCHNIQGYFFSKPKPANEIESILSR